MRNIGTNFGSPGFLLGVFLGPGWVLGHLEIFEIKGFGCECGMIPFLILLCLLFFEEKNQDTNPFQAGGDGGAVWDLVALLTDRLARHLQRHHHHNQLHKVIQVSSLCFFVTNSLI